MGSELDLNDLAHGNRLALEELSQLRSAERERDELINVLKVVRGDLASKMKIQITLGLIDSAIAKVKS